MSTVKLRAPEPSDLDSLYLWENDSTQWHNSLTPPMVSRHLLWQFLETSGMDLSAEGQIRLIVEDGDGMAVGTVDFSDYDSRNHTAWVSIYVDEAHRHRGIGFEALRQTLFTAAHAYGLERLCALVAADNAASIHLFLKAGFTECGRIPEWIRRGKQRLDMLIFSSSI